MKISIKSSLPALFVLILSLHGFRLFSQDFNKNNTSEHQAGDASVTSVMTAPLVGERNEPSEDVNWQPLITGIVTEHENPSPDEELLERIKAEKQKIKNNAESMRQGGTDETQSTNTYTPVIGKSYAGNVNSNTTPMDNCIAISDAGLVMSVANLTFRIYDSTGALKYNKGVLATISDTSIHSVCDEYVIYDRRADRFVAFAEECSASYLTSKLLILFSKTNDPAVSGWWYYKLPGNPFAGQTDWFDYPKMAVSDSELYISGNLFNGSTFHEAAMWQIKKSDGYSGNSSLTYQVWHQFADSPFTVCPVGEGQGNSYGPGCYMVTSNSTGGSTIGLYHLTNDIGSNPQVTYNAINTTSYSPSGNASQLGTLVTLKINDSRMMNGFYLDGIIHFVFNSDYNSTGYSAIYYGRLNVSSQTITSSMFGLSGYDYGYPSVSSFATSSASKSVMIGYGRSGSTIYPEMGIVNCDDGMNWSSGVVVKTSPTYIDEGSYTARWGDYTGTARHHSSNVPSIWMNGMIGNVGNYWSSWIAEIHEVTTGINEPGNSPLADAKIYPNPVKNVFFLDFTISQTSDIEVNIYDMEGRLVKDLFRGKAYIGENQFSFNKSNLTQGIYFLTIRSNSEILKNDKIVITD